jgi:hypothetical protein
MTLLIDKVRRIEGVTVYGDEKWTKFYMLADIPRFRRNDDGTLAFSYFKYRNPIDRADESKGGGFLVCDVEFVVDEAKQALVVARLQEEINQRARDMGIDPPPPVEIGSITYSDGTARLNIESMSDNFVESVFNPGKPSLYGRMITPFSVELTDLGATFFEQALQARGGFVQVSYDLKARVKLPPTKVTIWFNASEFYSFTETYRETSSSQGIFSKIGQWLFGGGGQDERKVSQSITEVMSQNNWGGIDIVWDGMPATKEAEEAKEKIREWAFATLTDAVKRMTAEPLEPLTAEERKVPKDVTEFRNRVRKFKFANFFQSYRESQVVDWQFIPQGMLQPITAHKDKDGNPLRWEDYATVIDLDDPFFKTLEVAVRVNADFADLPLDSVEVHLDYNQGGTRRISEFSFTDPDKLEKFKSFIENGAWEYTYYTQVNYKGESRQLQTPPKKTDEKFLTINVGDTGILAVDVLVGDINFKQVSQAHVTLRYDAPDGAIERQFILDPKSAEHKLREVIMAPVDKPYRYTVRYTMEDGKELELSEATSSSPQLYIRDPFGGNRRVGLRAAGDLEKDVQTIFADVKYVDEKHEYSRVNTVALGKANPFFDWDVPVIDEAAGYVLVSGTIQYKNGEIEPIPEFKTTDQTILIGKKVEDVLEVKVMPNRMGFAAQTDVVVVSLAYEDKANRIAEQTDLVFDATTPKTGLTWSVPLKNKALRTYTWKAVFYLKDGKEIPTALKTETASFTLLPALPTA